MIRIRFHGRGGHGVKTASRIVGTAAFLAGFEAQDSPVYGAERRGAAVVAFTRIHTDPILERGVIDRPDFIIVGDESLLFDPAAVVLSGQEHASAVFVNAETDEIFVNTFRISGFLVTVDVTARASRVLGVTSVLSVPLAAAAARLTGVIDKENLLLAVRQELAHTGVGEDLIERNLELASELFGSVPEVALNQKEGVGAANLWKVPYEGAVSGTPSILSPGNAEQRRTGSWRVERPEIDLESCTRCGLCFVYCPDGSIALDEEDYPVIDYTHCKGCMECWQLCPVYAIRREKEVRAW